MKHLSHVPVTNVVHSLSYHRGDAAETSVLFTLNDIRRYNVEI
jgi:hypothetical protein